MSNQSILRFDRRQLRQRVESLTHLQRVAFVLSVAERFFPYYLRFHQDQDWGDPTILRNALDLGWDTLAERPIKSDLLQLGKKIEQVCPNTETFQGAAVGLALAACSAAIYLLRTIASGAVEHTLEAAQAAVDAVDGYAGWLLFQNYVGEDTPQMWQQQLEHPLTQAELRRQNEDILVLRRKGSLDAKAIAELKDSWAEKDARSRFG